ncbi:MAG: transglutaminase domain-containing protein [Candidatus Jordarchaeales archaeon]
MASKAKKALIALLLAGLIVSAMAGYPLLATLLATLNMQGGLSSQLNSLFLSYFHHIPYHLSSPITIRLDMDWLTQMFKNPPPFEIPEELRNIPIDYIPPTHEFASGLIDPSMVIMVVEPHSSNYPHQYWKVSTFDYYGEGDWFKTQLGTYPISLTSPSSLPPNAQFFTVRMNLSHNTISSTVLPTLHPDPYFISIASSRGDLTDFKPERDDYNNSRVTLFFSSSGTSEIVYDVAGVPPDLTWIASRALPASFTPPEISNIYTQLPSQLTTNPTFTSFAQGFQGVGGNTYELASAVQAELLSGRYVNNFTLLLEGRPLPDKDPVVAFLETKEGTCIDFASTFVTTLRYLGVSARLVIGYYDLYAESNFSGGTLKYIIKADNIHAWAEVWVPTSTSGSGTWVPFDPTPPPTITPPSGTEWFDRQFNIPPDLIGTLGPISLFSYGLGVYKQVFNATPENPSSPVMYWRLKTFDYYNGDWNCSNKTTYELQTWTKTELENRYGTVWYYTVLIDLEHQVNLTTALPFPFPGPYILGGAGYTVSSTQGDMVSAALLSDVLGNLYLNAAFTGHGTSTIRYTAATYNLNLENIRSNAKPPDNIPPEIAKLYLQIPDNLKSNPTFMSFVNSITSGSNAYETALNALNRLSSGEYVYDFSLLLNGTQISGDPIVWFLTNKKGTPVLFASAFVMALRNLSIPARLVVGYLTANTTSSGGVVHVADSFMVHAWAEVWIQTGNGEGYWVSFDPTPEPLPPTLVFQNGLLLWDKLPRSDPNVQRTNFNVSISTSNIVTRETPFSVTVTVTKDGAPQDGLLVDVYVYDPWRSQEYFKGNGITSSGSVTVQVTVGNEVKVGNLTVIAKVHSSSSSTSPLIACSYTAKTILNGTVAINATISSTAPYTSGTTLIRSSGTVRINGSLYDPSYSGTIKGIPFAPIQVIVNGSNVDFSVTGYNGYFDYYYPYSMSLELADYNFQVAYSGIFGAAQSSVVTISVYARSQINLVNPPIAVKNGSTLSFTAYLSLDNGTPIEGASNVYLNWTGNIYGMTHAGGGNYACDVTVNVPQAGYYAAYAYFGGTIGGGGRILPSLSVTVSVLVYTEGLILINSYPAEVYRGDTAWFGGTVTVESGSPANIAFQFRFSNASGVIYTYNATEKTMADGSFYCSVPVPSWLAPGSYNVEAVSLNETFSGVSNIVVVQVKVKPSIIVSGFSSSSASLPLAAKQTSTLIGSFTPREYAFITASVVDSASGSPLGGLNFTAYYNGVALSSNITGTNGFLNITLSPDDLSMLPVNRISVLSVVYPGNETFGSAQFEVRIHVFNNANVNLSIPEKAVIGKPLTINVSIRDPNGNPVVGRSFTVYWNMTTNVGSAETGSDGNGTFTYNVPDDTAEGNLTIYVVIDTGDSAMVNIPVVKEDFTGGYIMALLYALQAGGSSPILPLFIIGVLVALLLVFVFVYVSRMKSTSVKKPRLTWNIESLDELAKAGKYREALIQLYRMYVELLNVYLRIERAPHETTRDIARKAIKGGLPPKLVNTMTQLFEKARFSKREVTSSDYKEAAKTLNEIYKEVTGGIISIG